MFRRSFIQSLFAASWFGVKAWAPATPSYFYDWSGNPTRTTDPEWIGRDLIEGCGRWHCSLDGKEYNYVRKCQTGPDGWVELLGGPDDTGKPITDDDYQIVTTTLRGSVKVWLDPERQVEKRP